MSTTHADEEERAALLPLLLDTLELITNQRHRGQLQRILEAAGKAVEALGDLDLSEFEADDEGKEAYEVWRALAPVVGETLETVYALLRTIDHEVASSEDRAGNVEQATRIGRNLAETVRQDCLSFRDGMQEPDNMANRWDVLQYVGAFRGRTRASVGQLMFSIATCFAKVNRSDVIPGYRSELEVAVSLRKALRALSERIQVHLDGLSGGNEAEIITHTQSIFNELAEFSSGMHYDHLRVFDRRQIVSLRQGLETALSDDLSSAQAICQQTQMFFHSLGINQRDSLVVHDTDTVRDAADCLRDAREALRLGELRARIEARSALRLIFRLQGKDPMVDQLIKIAQSRARQTTGVALEPFIGQLENILRRLG